MEVPSAENENSDLSKKDSPLYVGMIPHAHRIEEEKSGKEKKHEMQKWEKSCLKKIKILVERLKMDCYWLSLNAFMEKYQRID